MFFAERFVSFLGGLSLSGFMGVPKINRFRTPRQ